MVNAPKKYFFDTSEIQQNASITGGIPTQEYVVLDVLAMLVSLIGFPSNMAILYVIYMSPSLKTKCFLLIGALGGVDILYALQYFVSHFYSLGQMLGLWATNLSTTVCLFFSFFFYSSLENLLTCAVACDRLYAILAPTHYYITSKRITKLMLGTCFTLGVLNLCITFASSATAQHVHCRLLTPLTPGAVQYFMGSIMFLNMGALVLYLVLVFVARRQLISMGQNPNAAGNQFLQGHLRMLPTVHVILFIHSVTMVLPAVLVLGLMPILGDSVAFTRVSSWSCLFSVFNPVLNFFFYYWRSDEFKKCAKTLFSLGSMGNDVHNPPIPGTSGSPGHNLGNNIPMYKRSQSQKTHYPDGAQRVQPL